MVDIVTIPTVTSTIPERYRAINNKTLSKPYIVLCPTPLYDWFRQKSTPVTAALVFQRIMCIHCTP